MGGVNVVIMFGKDLEIEVSLKGIIKMIGSGMEYNTTKMETSQESM